jgi:multisubunit Na+/H+ antiporter MnhC subunit
MISTKKRLTFSLLAATMTLLLIPTANATAQSFTVHAGQEQTKLLNLAADDHVQIRFTVTGQATNVLDFFITDPNGNTIHNFGTTGNVNYEFVCSLEGEYTLHFSNAASAEDKLVSLDYEIAHYIFGMPQMLFLTLIVVGICIAAVAVFILMSKHP